MELERHYAQRFRGRGEAIGNAESISAKSLLRLVNLDFEPALTRSEILAFPKTLEHLDFDTLRALTTIARHLGFIPFYEWVQIRMTHIRSRYTLDQGVKVTNRPLDLHRAAKVFRDCVKSLLATSYRPSTEPLSYEYMTQAYRWKVSVVFVKYKRPPSTMKGYFSPFGWESSDLRGVTLDDLRKLEPEDVDYSPLVVPFQHLGSINRRVITYT